MRILLLQVSTHDIKDYAVHSLPRNLRYATEKGYDYFLYQNNRFQYPAMWLKIEVFKHLNYAEYDHIWVLDADCVINDFNIDLEEVINNDQKDVIISENGPNGGLPLNSGSIVYSARIVPELLARYDKWLAEKNPHIFQHWHDQQLINEWNDSHPEIFSVRDYSELNSWWGEMDPPNFVFHFMARDRTEKIDLIRKHLGA